MVMCFREALSAFSLELWSVLIVPLIIIFSSHSSYCQPCTSMLTQIVSSYPVTTLYIFSVHSLLQKCSLTVCIFSHSLLYTCVHTHNNFVTRIMFEFMVHVL